MECFYGFARDIVLGIMMLSGIACGFFVYCWLDYLQEKYWPGPQPNPVMPLIGFFPVMFTIGAVAVLVDRLIAGMFC